MYTHMLKVNFIPQAFWDIILKWHEYAYVEPYLLENSKLIRGSYGYKPIRKNKINIFKFSWVNEYSRIFKCNWWINSWVCLGRPSQYQAWYIINLKMFSDKKSQPLLKYSPKYWSLKKTAIWLVERALGHNWKTRILLSMVLAKENQELKEISITKLFKKVKIPIFGLFLHKYGQKQIFPKNWVQ